jgi:hypothetical protein
MERLGHFVAMVLVQAACLFVLSFFRLRYLFPIFSFFPAGLPLERRWVHTGFLLCLFIVEPRDTK